MPTETGRLPALSDSSDKLQDLVIRHAPVLSIGVFFFAIPYPHPPVKNLYREHAFGAVTQLHPLPGICRLLGCPLIYPNRRALRFSARWRFTPFRLTGRDHRLRVLQVDPLVFVHIS